jgi:hypothetical protein
VHPPPSLAWPNFTLMTECTPESRRYYSVYSVICPLSWSVHCNFTELEFLESLWGLGTEEEEGYRTGPPGYIGWRIHSLESIPGLHTRLKIRALVMVNVMKGGGRALPPLPAWANFPLMMECTPESSYCYSVYSVVWRCGGGVVLSCVVDHILQEFYTLFLTRFRTYKIASPPQTKMTSKDNI